MAPMPAGGDDVPQSDNGLQASPPAALTVSSSDEEDGEELAAAGYQPLPVGEPDDDVDVTGESDDDLENVAEAASASTESFLQNCKFRPCTAVITFTSGSNFHKLIA